MTPVVRFKRGNKRLQKEFSKVKTEVLALSPDMLEALLFRRKARSKLYSSI